VLCGAALVAALVEAPVDGVASPLDLLEELEPQAARPVTAIAAQQAVAILAVFNMISPPLVGDGWVQGCWGWLAAGVWP
jgi:hypothetical protein